MNPPNFMAISMMIKQEGYDLNHLVKVLSEVFTEGLKMGELSGYRRGVDHGWSDIQDAEYVSNEKTSQKD